MLKKFIIEETLTMKQENFSIRKRLESFKYAFNGLLILIKEEHNARIHLFATVCAIIAGIYFNISVQEWLSLVFAFGFVISLETVNSSLENIADFISPERHESIKRIKDLAAAAAITAFTIGLIIF